MKHSLSIKILIVLIAGFASACAGGRQKQAVAVQPAPGSTQPTGANGEQQTQQGGEQGQFPAGEGEQANPNGVASGDVPAGEGGEGANADPGSGGQSNGTATELIIEATLEDSSSVTSDVAWDGKSFKGSGKWTVAPMP